MELKRRGQGATEYLLILAAVLVIVAIAVYYVTSTGPSAIITGSAVKNGDNVNFTPSSTMVPSSIAASEWEYAVYRGATRVYPTASDWAPGSGTLQRGIPIALVAPGNQAGDVVKIRYQQRAVFDAGTVG